MMIQIAFDLASIDEAGKIVASKLEPGMPLLLFGEMGAGKTTLTKSIVRSLGCGDDVTSPTFTLMQSYQTKKYLLWHVDLYRLEDTYQINELGLEELSRESLVIIEWPQRLDKGFFKKYLKGNLLQEQEQRKLLLESVQ